MPKKYILAIDQGTTGTTAMLVDEQLSPVAKSNVEFEQIYPSPGWVEHSAKAIWSSVRASVMSCLDKASVKGSELSAIGITNQRETTCLFDSDGNAPTNFIVWQCKRSTSICDSLKAKGLENKIKSKTGLRLDPYFSGSKLLWLWENSPELYQKAIVGELKFGTIDSWLLYKLSGHQVHATDATNASRTLLMNLQTLNWDDELLDAFRAPKCMLPEIKSNAEVYGATKGLDFLPDGIPISGMAGDQQSALIGQACFAKGDIKATYGTGSFLLMNTGGKPIFSNNGLLTSVAYSINGTQNYCLEGSVFAAGAAVQWLRDNLGIIKTSQEVEALASEVESTGEVVFVPALAGLGSPHWQPSARGVIKGISRDTTKAHLARATLEGIAFQNFDVMTAMQAEAGEINAIKVDGGASRDNLLIQFQADLLQKSCLRPKSIETTALGAAALAGLGAGIFNSVEALKDTWKLDRAFEPSMDENSRESALKKWKNAVDCA